MKSFGFAVALVCGFATPAWAVRLIQPSFAREDCARALVARAGVRRSKVVADLRTLDQRALVPINFVETSLNLADHDADYAEFQLGPNATLKQVETARAAAHQRREKDFAGALAAPPAESTALTKLQAAALNISDPPVDRADAMNVRVDATSPGKLTLETTLGERVLGRVDLGLDTIEFGFEGDIAFWTFERTIGGGGRRAGAAAFVNDQGLAILRPTEPRSRFAFVFSFIELREFKAQGHMMVHVYTRRACDPNVALGGRVHAVPFRRENGRAWCFAPTGLKLRTFSVVDAEAFGSDT